MKECSCIPCKACVEAAASYRKPWPIKLDSIPHALDKRFILRVDGPISAFICLIAILAGGWVLTAGMFFVGHFIGELLGAQLPVRPGLANQDTRLGNVFISWCIGITSLILLVSCYMAIKGAARKRHSKVARN